MCGKKGWGNEFRLTIYRGAKDGEANKRGHLTGFLGLGHAIGAWGHEDRLRGVNWSYGSAWGGRATEINPTRSSIANTCVNTTYGRNLIQ
jgi:hypothetical protein